MGTTTEATGAVLTETEWRARAARHEERVDALTADHLRRRGAGERHPVEDFLFTYYNLKPAQLRRWHPGVGTFLSGAGARERLDERFYVEHDAGGVGLDVSAFLAARPVLDFVERLLSAVASRPAHLGCFGLHEWAMAYRTSEVRHGQVPLRLGHGGTDRVVESHRIQCSHFDAFRFFTEPARPLNTLQPTREAQADLDQPGCLHANMDLYKWAYKLTPAMPSELVVDCFVFSREIRTLDMRASPYDLREWGYEPVRIETAEGKAAYMEYQRDFAERGAVLRGRLLEVCRALRVADPRT
ncbi:3-methyladenine DNA glycosylase [Nocardiopsis sp. MG754419]|uniref:3-methyladenine DNA glycosylase n=1 Tax=Nocardiopsis sp. MG754419 TaxID=2259865 RepID=UPI001BA4A63E|nr:3-methyladenine DNA glycosylase [Nocardiopsis sp. MG754419]MBR8744703.1 3-methyladenine DNA glycosylase [Nocardiopsis sp. MG754419]